MRAIRVALRDALDAASHRRFALTLTLSRKRERGIAAGGERPVLARRQAVQRAEQRHNPHSLRISDEPQSPTTRRRRILRRAAARARRRGLGQDARDHREDRAPDPAQASVGREDRRDHVHEQGCARDARARRAARAGHVGRRADGVHVPCARAQVPADRARARRFAPQFFGVRRRRQPGDPEGSPAQGHQARRVVRAAIADFAREERRACRRTRREARARRAVASTKRPSFTRTISSVSPRSMRSISTT